MPPPVHRLPSCCSNSWFCSNPKTGKFSGDYCSRKAEPFSFRTEEGHTSSRRKDPRTIFSWHRFFSRLIIFGCVSTFLRPAAPKLTGLGQFPLSVCTSCPIFSPSPANAIRPCHTLSARCFLGIPPECWDFCSFSDLLRVIYYNGSRVQLGSSAAGAEHWPHQHITTIGQAAGAEHWPHQHITTIGQGHLRLRKVLCPESTCATQRVRSA